MLFRLISKWKDLISIFLLAIWWKFLCWCFVPDRRKPANSVSAVSHFWAFLFFLDLLCFYELKLVFDGDIDSDVLLQASRKKKGQSGFCRWSFCNFCCCCYFARSYHFYMEIVIVFVWERGEEEPIGRLQPLISIHAQLSHYKHYSDRCPHNISSILSFLFVYCYHHYLFISCPAVTLQTMHWSLPS